MNKWQTRFCIDSFQGRYPILKDDKKIFNMLGELKEKVIVHFPDRIDTLTITETDNDIPNGKISVRILASNLRLWTSKGLKIETI